MAPTILVSCAPFGVNRIGAPDILVEENVPIPVAGRAEVLIDVKSLGRFVDTLFRDGTFALAVPFTPGV